MHGTETVLVSNTLVLIFNFFSIAIFSLLSICDLVMFWITFGQGMVKYIVPHVKRSTSDAKSTRLLNLSYSKPITGTLAYEQI